MTIAAVGLAALIPTPVPQPDPAPAARDSAWHVVNRLAFGADPELVEEVARIGALNWVDRQLGMAPGDDRALAHRERRFSLLLRSTSDLTRQFRDVQRTRLAQARTRTDSPPRPATPPATGPGRELRELTGQLPAIAALRATVAEHQVLEVMADFWTNHFNVFGAKNLDQVLLPEYIERVIRPHALGRFEELLVATARSPAMLVYLDNALSVAPGSEPPGLDRLRARPGRRRLGRRVDEATMERIRERIPTGLNENYARELLELHTLGVDGGYRQEDVVAVARILTGWSIDRGLARGGAAGGFVFNDWAHDRGAKTALGVEFPAGHGEDEGRRLLSLLARHPATLHHVSAKLCARLVADTPPDGCIDDAVAAWRRSDGRMAEVVRAIVRGPDFWSPAVVGAKIKTPFEFVVSAARAIGADPDTSRTLALAIARLGQPLYLQSAPTGYPEAQEDWVNAGALLARMNLAVTLASGRLPGVTVDLDRIVPLGAPDDLVGAVDRAILAGRMSANTRAVIEREIAGLEPRAARNLAVGLALGGPEFQRQ